MIQTGKLMSTKCFDFLTYVFDTVFKTLSVLIKVLVIRQNINLGHQFVKM